MKIVGKVLIKGYNGDTKNGTFVIPSNVTKIGKEAFCYCFSLQDITIPNSVTDIGVGAFNYCKSLTNINLPSSITEIGDETFNLCESLTHITIPDSVTKIGGNAFYRCTSLTNITVPNSVTEIGRWAFGGCTSLTNITVPNSVTKIGDRAFGGCTSLTNIILPDGITIIECSTFENCKSLENITIPNGVTEIGGEAFSGCTSLTHITIPDGVTRIGYGVFSHCESLTHITVPSSVTEIGDWAFDECKSLTHITLPNSITEIGDRAFSGCTSLKNITLPNSVTKIGDWAFASCGSLAKVTFHSSLINIGYEVFEDCNSLRKIIFYNQKINQNSFKEELNKVRQKELLDKITFCLSNRGILDKQHYDYNYHKTFIEETIKKYEYGEYYYKDDFDKYIEKYILNISSTYDDEQMKKICESLKQHQVENLDPNDVHSIVTYGNALESYPNYFTGMLHLITIHYGIDSSTDIKKVIDTISKPQNLVQFLSAAFDSYNGGTKYYLNKEAISKLQKFADTNVDRLTQGILKAEKLKEAIEIYMEKMNQYIKNLLSFKPIQSSENLPEILKNPISINEEVSQKLGLYQANMMMMSTFYEQVNNLIEEYTGDVLKLKGVQDTLLPGIEMASSLNKGILRTEQNIGMLEKILSRYKVLLGIEDDVTDVTIEHKEIK